MNLRSKLVMRVPVLYSFKKGEHLVRHYYIFYALFRLLWSPILKCFLLVASFLEVYYSYSFTIQPRQGECSWPCQMDCVNWSVAIPHQLHSLCFGIGLELCKNQMESDSKRNLQVWFISTYNLGIMNNANKFSFTSQITVVVVVSW